MNGKCVKINAKLTQQTNSTRKEVASNYVNFLNIEDINQIYNIKDILGCKFEVQPSVVPQCKGCQAYGHIKSIGKHLTWDCKKKITDEKPNYVHCGEAHLAIAENVN